MPSTLPANKPLQNPCYAHHHLTLEEYGLWTHAREVSHATGVFYLSGPAVAEHFSETGKGPVYRVGKSLARKGWFVVLRERWRDKNGILRPTEVRALSHDEWAAVHPGNCAAANPAFPQTGKGAVPQNAPHLSSNRALPFPESSSAFPQTGNKSDKEKSETNESEKEKSIAPFLKPGKATALQGSENERRSLAKKFFVWLNKTHCDLSLNRKYRGEIEGFVLSATFELPVLQEAANEILNGLDPRNSFDQAPDKLATNLPDRCQAIWEQHEQAKQQQKDMKRAEQQLADEVAREDAERAARKAEEPAPLSDKELFS